MMQYMHVLRKNGWYKKVRNYFLIIGSTSYFDDYLSKIDVEKDSFIELVRQDDTQRKGGVITWDPSPNLVVRNSDYHGLVASAHDRLGELIKEFTTEDAYIYIHNPPAALVRQLMAQYELGDIVVKKKNEEYDINRDPKAFAAGISEIQKKIIGQETAIKDISKSIWYLTKVNRKKPYVVMLYGNSSLGKTQLVREIAKSFFKSKYMEKHLSMFKNGNYAEYFFGNEPNRSSIGFELLERESNLVFLDEIDKCPEMFYSAFYTLFDNTVFKDYTYDVDISGVLIILTANYTSMEEMKTALGLPIFYRIDKFIHFDDFSKENIYRITKKEIHDRKPEYSEFFTEEDLEKGQIEVANRKGIIEQFSLTSISIGAVIADKDRFANILEIGEIGAQVKHVAKSIIGSSYAVDRRHE